MPKDLKVFSLGDRVPLIGKIPLFGNMLDSSLVKAKRGDILVDIRGAIIFGNLYGILYWKEIKRAGQIVEKRLSNAFLGHREFASAISMTRIVSRDGFEKLLDDPRMQSVAVVMLGPNES
jgi:hypothetical protein